MPHLNAQITTQAIIRNSRNEILLLKRSKHGGWFTLPGGTVEQGEDIKACLKRELLEETGLDLKVDTPVWIWQSDHIGKDLLGIVFSIDNKVADDAIIKLSPEHNEFKWYNITDLFNDENVDPYIKKDELK